jgi:hypothetical protein
MEAVMSLRAEFPHPARFWPDPADAGNPRLLGVFAPEPRLFLTGQGAGFYVVGVEFWDTETVLNLRWRSKAHRTAGDSAFVLTDEKGQRLQQLGSAVAGARVALRFEPLPLDAHSLTVSLAGTPEERERELFTCRTRISRADGTSK